MSLLIYFTFFSDWAYYRFIAGVLILLVICVVFFIKEQRLQKYLKTFSSTKKYLSNNYCNIGVAKDLSCIKIFEKNKNPRRIITIYTYRSEAPVIWNLFCSVFNEYSDIDFWKNFCLEKKISIKETVEEKNQETDNSQIKFFSERNIDI